MRLLFVFASLPRFDSLLLSRLVRPISPRDYRRTHEIESVAASFGDYLLLEAAYDVDFDE